MLLSCAVTAAATMWVRHEKGGEVDSTAARPDGCVRPATGGRSEWRRQLPGREECLCRLLSAPWCVCQALHSKAGPAGNLYEETKAFNSTTFAEGARDLVYGIMHCLWREYKRHRVRAPAGLDPVSARAQQARQFGIPGHALPLYERLH